MRLKVFLCVVLAACGLVLLLAFLRPMQGARTARTEPPIEPKRDQTAASRLASASPLPAETEAALPPGPALTSTNQPADNEAEDRYISQVLKRVTELGQLAMEDDAASLATILSELENPEPQIREAALQAAVQFGSRDAIPRLREVALRTDDPRAKRALEEAADFLTLPSLTEVLEERKQTANRR